MSVFRVRLDPQQPFGIVYLGVGLNEKGEREAVFARQTTADPRDVCISNLSRFLFNLYVGSQYRQDNPLLASDDEVMERGVREAEGNAAPDFTIDEKRRVIALASDPQEIIAAPFETHGFKIAVCEVVGTSHEYEPSCLATTPEGFHVAKRLQGVHRPN